MGPRRQTSGKGRRRLDPPGVAWRPISETPCPARRAEVRLPDQPRRRWLDWLGWREGDRFVLRSKGRRLALGRPVDRRAGGRNPGREVAASGAGVYHVA